MYEFHNDLVCMIIFMIWSNNLKKKQRFFKEVGGDSNTLFVFLGQIKHMSNQCLSYVYISTFPIDTKNIFRNWTLSWKSEIKKFNKLIHCFLASFTLLHKSLISLDKKNKHNLDVHGLNRFSISNLHEKKLGRLS